MDTGQRNRRSQNAAKRSGRNILKQCNTKCRMTEIQASYLQMASLGKGPFNLKQGVEALEARSSNTIVFSLQ